ncbi:hypothetical protein DL93DRAFT_2088573, partial [Clavulina sp. PMI_390]
MDADTESYILLLLSDGNLPTGSFVASSGLESYEKHGFFSLASSSVPTPDNNTSQPPAKTAAVMSFMRDNVQSYANSTLPFVSAVYGVCDRIQRGECSDNDGLRSLTQLDDLYEATTLNHVARRASTAQGVALLTLLGKGLTKPVWLGDGGSGKQSLEQLADSLKLEIRRGNSHGHLPICWAVLTAALGLSCPRSQHLFMFLQARSLLSASIRLNSIGPYAAQQLLLHFVRPLVEAAVQEAGTRAIRYASAPEDYAGDLLLDESIEDGPVVTWPLGEVIAARHDQQHSRIFN